MAEEKKKTMNEKEKRLVAEVLRIERANARRDTAKQKSRSEVRGGGAKPWRQKGTGRSRQGSIRSVQWVGGGRAFNTTLENHHRKINKKARRRALQSVLELKTESGRVLVDKLQYDAPSTKTFVKFLEEKEATGKVLFLHDGSEDVRNAVKSARNIKNVTVLHADSINLHSLLNAEWLVTVPVVAERLNLKNG